MKMSYCLLVRLNSHVTEVELCPTVDDCLFIPISLHLPRISSILMEIQGHQQLKDLQKDKS